MIILLSNKMEMEMEIAYALPHALVARELSVGAGGAPPI
jgi:hypothetical protein